MNRTYRELLGNRMQTLGMNITELADECAKRGLASKVSKAHISRVLRNEADPPRDAEVNRALGEILGCEGKVLQLLAEAHYIEKNAPEIRAVISAAAAWLFHLYVTVSMARIGSPADQDLLPALDMQLERLKDLNGANADEALKLQLAKNGLLELKNRLAVRQWVDDQPLEPVAPAIKLLAQLSGADVEKWDADALILAAGDTWTVANQDTVFGSAEARQAAMDSARAEILAATSPEPTKEDILKAIERLTRGSRRDVYTFIAPLIDALTRQAAAERNTQTLKAWGIDPDNPRRKPGPIRVRRTETLEGTKLVEMPGEE